MDQGWDPREGIFLSKKRVDCRQVVVGYVVISHMLRINTRQQHQLTTCINLFSMFLHLYVVWCWSNGMIGIAYTVFP